MTNVLQSGSVTPNHLATWVTDGVIKDGGSILAAQKVLGSIRGADFSLTTDQPLLIPPSITAFQLTGIIVTNSTISLTTAVGGFYPNASKAGTAIVANTQVYSSLTAVTKLLSTTLSSGAQTTRYSSANLDQTLGETSYQLTMYLSLTTGQGVAAPADVYAIGIDLS